MVTSKILFMGPPAAGKTTLRRFLFEGVPALELLEHPETPTVGLKYNAYAYVSTKRAEKDKKAKKAEVVPISLSVVDSAGQNLDEWLNERKDRVFPGADVIFFIFDVSEWLQEDNKKSLSELIMRIYNTRLELAPESSFYIVGHKFDKIPEGKTYRDAMAKRIKRELNDYIFDKMLKYLDFDIYLTSIQEEFADETFLTLINLTTDLLSRAAAPK
ncbi:MAG: 50S ribosome-binding GTPase [Candidatus Lokiarchaeota archaeon]|nr:50S ribosome-binding GTPase [Candidatus Lokiarchaeota archaeon]